MDDDTDPPAVDRTIGRRLLEVRAGRGLSLRAAAEPAGFSASYLSMIERGERPVDKRPSSSARPRTPGCHGRWSSCGQRWNEKLTATFDVARREIFRLKVQQMTAFHRINSAAGEQITVARRAEHPDLATLTEDFWMFDEQVVAVMNYDAEHRPLGPNAPSRPVSEYVAQRDLALSHAIPLDRWMTEHPELQTG